MATIGLISCVASKQGRPAPAAELYTSQLFQKAKAFVAGTCDRWFVLSAQHGLLPPDEVVAPYDQSLNTMPKARREAWTASVFAQLQPMLHPGDQVVMLAGDRYRAFLLPLLERAGHPVRVPLAGMRIGEQLRWLNANTG